MTDFSDEIDEDTLSGPDRRQAHRDWIDFLFPELLEPISFGRADNKSYSVEQIIGLAAAAANGNGLDSAARMLPWYYKESEIPSSDNVKALFDSQDRNDIEDTFAEVNKRFIDIAKDFGFFTDPHYYAYDPTLVGWEEGDFVHWDMDEGAPDADEDDEEGEDEEEAEDDEEDESENPWNFAVASVVNLEARFCFGVNYIEGKKQESEKILGLMRNIAEEVDVGLLLADRGFHGGDAVRKASAVAGEKYMIRAKKIGKVGELLEETPVGESDFERNIDFSDVTPGPNAAAVPTKPWDKYSDPHIGLLIGFDPEDSPIDLYDAYGMRRAIEDTIRRLKSEFGIKSKHREIPIQLYLFNLSNLFYNIWVLMNRAPGPETVVPLDVAYDEALRAITDYAFTPDRSLRGFE